MSKKKTKKKKNQAPKKKKRDIKSLLILLAVVAVVGFIIGGFYLNYRLTSLECTDFADSHFESVKAFDASGDEANLKEVYDNRYDAFTGSLDIMGDGTFSFWMSVGYADDGTHKGEYTYDRSKEVLNATFDNGDKAKFRIIRKDGGAIDYIEAPYQDYKIRFKFAYSLK